MKLTIITVNYNNREGMRKTRDSVLRQTFRDFEWLIIDGGSTDGVEELLFPDPENRITRFISEPDNGIYDAMNKGIALSRGEYLYFLNSGDSLYAPDTLQQVFSRPTDADCLYGAARFVSESSRKIRSYPKQLDMYFFYTSNLCHQAAFIRRELFDRYGAYDLSYTMVADWVFFFTALVLNQSSSRLLPLVVADYDTEGVSSLKKEQVHEERSRFLNAHLSHEMKLLNELYTFRKDVLYEVTEKMKTRRFVYGAYIRLGRLIAHFIR